MGINDSTNNNEIFDLIKQGLSTFYNIWQMIHYREQYLIEKESLDEEPNSGRFIAKLDREKVCVMGRGDVEKLRIYLASR